VISLDLDEEYTNTISHS